MFHIKSKDKFIVNHLKIHFHIYIQKICIYYIMYNAHIVYSFRQHKLFKSYLCIPIPLLISRYIF